ncbi:MAG TPA: hypothetical protein VFQ61_02400 [Polyangiaceae bacterium]|nr:hypothetical protein [Polyangiaceae bacterium]
MKSSNHRNGAASSTATDEDLEISVLEGPALPDDVDSLFDASEDDVTVARPRSELLSQSDELAKHRELLAAKRAQQAETAMNNGSAANPPSSANPNNAVDSNSAAPDSVSPDSVPPDSAVPISVMPIESQDFIRDRPSDEPVTMRRPDESRTATTRRVPRMDRTPHPPRRANPRRSQSEPEIRELPSDAPTAADAPHPVAAEAPRNHSLKWAGVGLLLVIGLIVGKRLVDAQHVAAPTAAKPPAVEPAEPKPATNELVSAPTLPIAEPSASLQSAASASNASEISGDASPPTAGASDPKSALNTPPANPGGISGPAGARANSQTQPRNGTRSVSSLAPNKASTPGNSPTKLAPAPDEGASSAFDAAAANAALTGTAAKAGACRQADDPSGVAVVTITFAPSGRVTSATISGPPFAGTKTGSCIASTLRSTRVPAYEGEFITVRKTVVID